MTTLEGHAFLPIYSVDLFPGSHDVSTIYMGRSRCQMGHFLPGHSSLFGGSVPSQVNGPPKISNGVRNKLPSTLIYIHNLNRRFSYTFTQFLSQWILTPCSSLRTGFSVSPQCMTRVVDMITTRPSRPPIKDQLHPQTRL